MRIYKKLLTDEQFEEIAKIYPTTKNEDIAKMYGVKWQYIQKYAHLNRWRKDPDFIKSCARSGQFKRGSVPVNKGKKQSEFMSPEMIERTKATRFKKGQKPHNTKYDGHERVCRDGYIEVRVSEGKYVHKHRLEWEKVNGPIPEKMILVCKTADKLNSSPSNWELISRVENMDRNSGPKNLTDNMVATYLSKDSRQTDKELKEEILKHPVFGLLPTPAANLGHSPYSPGSMERKHYGDGKRKSGAQIGSSLKWHPISMKYLKGGWIHPMLPLTMMGFPPNWTELPFKNGRKNLLEHQETQ